MLDPVRRLEREGFDVVWLPVYPQGDSPDQQHRCGQIDLDQLRSALNEDTALVSLMWANNEIGTLQPMKAIADIVHEAGALLHCDATQAVGRLPIDLENVWRRFVDRFGAQVLRSQRYRILSNHNSAPSSVAAAD